MGMQLILESHMNDLMAHVESIVRPIRATEARKLRMRRELLLHLQSAYDEELSRNPDGAFTRAKHRLGQPADITAQLQQSVPALERLLLMRLSTPRSYDQWESRAARRIWGAQRPMTLAHASLLIAASVILPYAACLLLVFRAGHPSTYFASLVNHPIAAILFNLFFIASIFLLVFSAGRFILATSNPRRLFLPAFSITTLLLLTLFVCVLGLARRSLSPADFATAALVIPALLLSLALVGQLLSTLQRRYDDWLSLSVAA